MKEATEFFNLFLNLDHVPQVAIENPVMARKHTGIRKPDFTCQPWQFGDNFKKRTCFWTKNLPKLKPTSNLDGSTAVEAVWLMGPSETRGLDRSKTYPGLAKAMAKQWGSYESNSI